MQFVPVQFDFLSVKTGMCWPASRISGVIHIPKLEDCVYMYVVCVKLIHVPADTKIFF